MEDLLDRFFGSMEFSRKKKVNMYFVKVSQVGGSFYVLIRKPRGNVLGDDYKYMSENVKKLSEKIYRSFAEISRGFRYKFFPYFKLDSYYNSCPHHFLVVRKYYFC